VRRRGVNRNEICRLASGLAGAWALCGPLAGAAMGQGAGGATPFATRVVAYAPVPAEIALDPDLGDPTRALGAPVGGGPRTPDNSKIVTLGAFGGAITLGFAGPIVDQPVSSANPRGLDFIVFGNAFYVAGNAQRRWAEAGRIEVSADANGNGEADDAWFVIPGSHLGVGEVRLPAAFRGPIVVNPLGDASMAEGAWGYADFSPVMVLGDVDGDGVVDDPGLSEEAFYTRPDDPLVVGITLGSGGGDAIDISWAVDPETGATAGLESIDFVRIVTAVEWTDPVFGARSTEVGGVAVVRVKGAGRGDFNGDGVVDPDDLADYIACYFAAEPCAGADFNGDGVVDPDDLADYIAAYFSEDAA